MKHKNATTILTIALLMSSCEYGLDYYLSDGIPNQDVTIEFSSFDESWEWVARNITYKKSESLYNKQLPEETFRLRTGDCEDFSLLLGWFAVNLGCDVTVVRVWMYGGKHIILKVDGQYLEPQRYGMYYRKEDLNILKTWTYREAFYSNDIRSIEDGHP